MKASFWSYSYTFKTPAGTSRGILTAKPAYFLDVDAQGLRGQGECGLLPGLSVDDRPDYEPQLHGFCRALEALGEATWADWASVGALDPAWSQAWQEWPSFVFAAEQALRSWADRARGGDGTRHATTPFARGEAGIPINGLLWMGSSCYLHDQSEARLTEGFRCLKMKVGALDFDAECDVLRHNRGLDAQLELRVDANGAWSADLALERMERLHGQVVATGSQVLPNGQHIDAMVAHVLHHSQNFFVRFTQSHHQAALGRYMRMQSFEFFQ